MNDTGSQSPDDGGAEAEQGAPPLHVTGAGGGSVIEAGTLPAPESREDDRSEPDAVEPADVEDEDERGAIDEAGAEDDVADPEAADAADHTPDPRPLFSELGLSEPIVRAVEEKGYLHPTPIQAQAIPYVLMGRDVLGVAQTGTGKTAGFTLPLLEILSDSRARARMPRSLILEPTRELALQVAENFVDYGRHLKLNHALLIGGESMSDQKEALARGVDVLIATPGRLLDLFERGGLLLNDTRILVIDEADRMLDMGFIPDVERIVTLVSPMRQTLFFSATMAPEIRRLADAFLSNPKEISVARAASVAATIEARLVLVDESDKRRALRALIRSEAVGNALIFCNRKRDVDVLSRSLLKHGFSAGALHGDLAQSVRFATLERFKAGEIQLLVCSDVAARGIDIGGLSHVFNFDVPIHSEDYVHRIGRTGRAGRTGQALTIAGPEDRLLVDAIERLIGAPIPRVAVDGVDTAEWAAGEPGADRRRGGRGRARGGSGPDRAVRRDGGGRRDRPERGERVGGERPGGERAGGERTGGGERVTADRGAPPDRRERRPAESAPRRPGEGRDLDRPTRNGSARDAGGRGRRDEGNGRWRGGGDDLGPAVLGFGDLMPDFMGFPRRDRALAIPDDADDAVRGERATVPADDARRSTPTQIPVIAAPPPPTSADAASMPPPGIEGATGSPGRFPVVSAADEPEADPGPGI